jgi:curved DNA-binding protein CbpA
VAADRDPYEVLGISRFAPWRDVRATYRALARRYHPDGTAPDQPRMAAINLAYEQIERDQRRRGADGSGRVPVGPGTPAARRPPARPAAGSLMGRILAARRVETPVLDFGEYAGWHIADVAEHDPRYLRWLSRHSAGMRFRAVIEQVLGPDPEIGRQAAILR